MDRTSEKDWARYLSSSLELRRTEEYGRGVYTRAAVPAAGRLMMSAEPLVHVVSNSEDSGRCDWCLRRCEEKLKKCSRCKAVRYCNQTCQRRDWLLHKRECNLISEMGVSGHTRQVTRPPDTLRLVLKLLQIKKQSKGKQGHLPDGAEWEGELLCSNLDKMENAVQEKMAGLMVTLASILEGQEATDAHRILSILLSNTFNILDEDLNTIGSALYIGPSLLNHSCVPNCVISFVGAKAFVRSVRPLQPGEQLLVSYVDLLEPQGARNQQLNRYYCFTCHCDRCSHGNQGDQYLCASAAATVPPSLSESIMERSLSKLKDLEQLKKNQDWKGLAKACVELRGLQDGVLHPLNCAVIRTHEALMDTYIALCDWEKALETAIKLTDAYKCCLFRNHPTVGVHLLKVSRLCKLLDTIFHLEKAIQCDTEALDILEVSLGMDHSVFTDAKRSLWDVQQELVLRRETALKH